MKLKLKSNKNDGKKIKFKIKPSSKVTKDKPTPKFKLNLSTKPKIKMVPKVPIIKLKVFGDGYDSESPDKEEDPLFEEGIILRLMKDAELDYVKHCVEQGSKDLSGLNIRWKDSRRAVIVINNSYYLAKLVDLPTIIETQKSVDKKNVFKTFDVCQMLYAFKKISANECELFFNHTEEDDVYENGEDEVSYQQTVVQNIKKAYDDIPDASESGITPPMHQVSGHRFKPVLNVKHIEKIENKVEELLRFDEEADSVQLTLMNTDDYNNSLGSFQTSSFVHPQNNQSISNLDSLLSPNSNIESTPEPEEQEVEVEGDEIDEKDMEEILNDYGLEGIENEVEIERASEEEEEDDDDDDDDDDDEGSDEEEYAESGQKQNNKILKEEIEELESAIQEKTHKIQDIQNEILKSRVMGTVQKLKHELEVKKRLLKTEEDKEKKARDAERSEEEDEEDEDDEEEDDDDDDEEEEEEEEDDESEVESKLEAIKEENKDDDNDDDDPSLEGLF